MSTQTKATASQIKSYFGYNGEGSSAQFAGEWKKLTAQDKEELADGVGKEIAEGRFQA